MLSGSKGPKTRNAKIHRPAKTAKPQSGRSRRLLQFQLTDSAPLLYHNEVILRDGKIEFCLTSGNYGHHLGASIGLGYVSCTGETAADMLDSTYEIKIAGERFPAIASIKPLYDPKSKRVKVWEQSLLSPTLGMTAAGPLGAYGL